ncbi:hypothetical protein Ciccas_007934 [Cichlidogyrus casuarinus]|uniref:Uncharacterized protein n=1 Tax=Cichlidogyrus casuarinus TaxID=1844966 RepID=A0ABD2Q1E5_9PLAT
MHAHFLGRNSPTTVSITSDEEDLDLANIKNLRRLRSYAQNSSQGSSFMKSSETRKQAINKKE